MTGEYPVCFRPLGGVLNETVIDAAKKKHHIVVLWSRHQDARDWSNPGVEKIMRQVTSHAQPGQIILMHDSGVNRVQTVKALEKILALLSKQGYKFVTVSDLIHQGVKEGGRGYTPSVWQN